MKEASKTMYIGDSASSPYPMSSMSPGLMKTPSQAPDSILKLHRIEADSQAETQSIVKYDKGTSEVGGEEIETQKSGRDTEKMEQPQDSQLQDSAEMPYTRG